MMTATQQVQAMSVMGLPLISVKFATKVDYDTDLAERSVLFGAY